MAKRLEEHLYRSAQRKEEYLDSSTLKKRLQLIAHGLESHRTISGGSTDDSTNKPPAHDQAAYGNASSSDVSSDGNKLQQMQQLQQFQQLQQQNLGGNNKSLMDNLNPMMLKPSNLTQEDFFREQAKQISAQQANVPDTTGYQSVFGQAGSQMSALQLQESILKAQQSQSSEKQLSALRRTSVESTIGILKNNSKYQDPEKKKVLKQQQERLMLLRHASKCKSGAYCRVKFCGQMVQLWKHMKKCRDKKCMTAHCLSSRCVLNHYRICKSENKTSSCEVCGPVMRLIKQQTLEKQDDMEPSPVPLDDSLFSLNDPQFPVTDSAVMVPSSLASASQLQNADEAMTLQTRQHAELQVAQQKLQQQHMLLKQLQRQQVELMEQQQRLQQQQQHVLPQTQQGQQLQDQQSLLQQLQQQFKQQQLLLQQELIRQSHALQCGQAISTQSGQVPSSGQTPQVNHTSQITQSDVLDGGTDGKHKKRGTTALRRTSKKSLERQLSGLNKQGKQVRGCGSGKGKRLNELGSQVDGDDNSVIFSDFLSPVGKRLAVELDSSVESTSSIAGPPSKTMKHNGDPTSYPTIETSMSSTFPQQRVLEQGNADHTTSLVPSMPQEAIEQHLASLHGGLRMTPRAISSKCLPVIRRMLDDQFGWVFRDPVDPVALGLPDYFDVVKNPMHLSLIEENVENGVYKDMSTFERETKLVFENAILYNGDESEVGEMAKTMLLNFAKDFTGVVDGKNILVLTFS